MAFALVVAVGLLQVVQEVVTLPHSRSSSVTLFVIVTFVGLVQVIVVRGETKLTAVKWL